ncbi:MAG: 6-bladed beta-propeller [Bacteroidales bacterium]|nr:6-bladed beta-propeller [Bacteroidales bacterium]
MKKTCFFICMILSFSCSNDHHDLYNFDPRTLEEKPVFLSDIADDVTFIPLDNSVPLGLIYNDIFFCNNSIYLSTKDNGVLAFSRSGKFLRNIGTKGRGPGEYAYSFDIGIDEDNEIIYVRDNRTIRVFSSKGRFIRSFSVESFGRIERMEIFDSKIYATFYAGEKSSEFAWIVLDSLGKMIKRGERRLPVFEANYGAGAGIYRFMNQISYWDNFIDTVYSVSPDLTEKPSFIISTGNHRSPRGRIKSFEDLENKLVLKSIFETKKFLVIRYFYQKPTIAMIEKDSHRYFLVYLAGDDSGLWESNFTGGLTDDLSGGPAFLPHSSFEEDGIEYMFGLIDSWQIKSHVESPGFSNTKSTLPDKKEELKKLAASLKETDNSVIVLVRLKK